MPDWLSFDLLTEIRLENQETGIKYKTLSSPGIIPGKRERFVAPRKYYAWTADYST